MEELVLQRLTKVINDKSKNCAQFASTIGIGTTTLNQYMTGKRKLSLDAILKTLSTFENISAEWLLRGNGAQFIDERKEIEVPIMTNDEIMNAMQTINNLSNKVKELYDENQRLKEQLKK